MPAKTFHSGWIYYAGELKAKVADLTRRCVAALAEEEVRLHRQDVLRQIGHKGGSKSSPFNRENSS